MEHVESQSDLAVSEEYDTKDVEIEEQFQEIYDAAMDAFDLNSRNIDGIDPRYRARNHEVAVQYLNAALSAAREKANLKGHKDKLSVAREKTSGARVTNNNLFVGDRNELLKLLQKEGNK